MCRRARESQVLVLQDCEAHLNDRPMNKSLPTDDANLRDKNCGRTLGLRAALRLQGQNASSSTTQPS